MVLVKLLIAITISAFYVIWLNHLIKKEGRKNVLQEIERCKKAWNEEKARGKECGEKVAEKIIKKIQEEIE